jgi:hypothetical protein
VKGDSVEHWLNGVRVVAFRIGSKAFVAAMHLSNTPLKPNGTLPDSSRFFMAGSVGILGTWGGPWRMRNLRIAALPLIPVSIRKPQTQAQTPGASMLHPSFFEWKGGDRNIQGRARVKPGDKRPRKSPLK